MRTSRLIVAVALAVIAAAPRAATPDANGLGERIDAFVRAEMERQRIPGVAIGIVRNGSTIRAQGYGYANVEHMVPAGPDTIFQSGSLGKQFTTAAVMLQVEDGKLSLSDDIAKFFPDAPQAWRSITIRHLLTHTSGLPREAAFPYWTELIFPTSDQVREALPGQKAAYPPEIKWKYSNLAITLLVSMPSLMTLRATLRRTGSSCSAI